jgi:hypothetical protein
MQFTQIYPCHPAEILIVFGVKMEPICCSGLVLGREHDSCCRFISEMQPEADHSRPPHLTFSQQSSLA